MFEGLLASYDFSSLFTREAIFVVLSLIVIEGLLSVDNALAIAAMAKHLPEKKRRIAMTVGYAGAYGFRILALFIAEFIINNHWLMILGASYLIWLMCNHFAEEEQEDEAGREPGYVQPYGFAKTIAMIAFLDLSLSFDNVVAAVAFARDNILMVYLGVTIGIITLRMVAGYCIKLIGRFPWLEHTAFILVGFVGMLLCAELAWDQLVKSEVRLGYISIISSDEGEHFHISKIVKFSGIVGLIVGHILYERYPRLKAIFRPTLKVIQRLLGLIAKAVNSIFRVVFFPIRLFLK